MNMARRKSFVLGGYRTPFVKSFSSFSRISNLEMLTFALNGLIERTHLKNVRVGDVGFGAIMTHPSDWNLSREVVLSTSLDPNTPAYNLQRACGTGLENAVIMALKISCGQIESGIAGGSDTNSDLPATFPRKMGWKLVELNKARTLGDRLKVFSQFRFSDLVPQVPAVVEPRTGLSMGQHCEKMVQEWGISREAQDELALASHHNAARAYQSGFFDDLLGEFKGVKKDLNVRSDTTLEKLAKLKPAFDLRGKGTLTAGNSSPLTDGASVVLLGSEEFAQDRGLELQAEFVDAEVAAVNFVKGEGLLMAPTIAVSRLLSRHNLKLQDFDFYEIHEAFAGQVLCNLKAWESSDYCKKVLGRSEPLGAIDRKKLNVNGSSLALGHPFAATGGRIVASLAKMLHQRGSGRGLISICTAGGMGVCAILER